MVSTIPAGGPSDIAARIIGQRMSEDWGQPVIVDNRPGANTIIGAETVAKAAPDGRWREHCCSRHLLSVRAYYGVSPYMALSWPWAKARAGGISILPPMISI